MIRFSKIFFYITVAVLLVWQLPWCYAFLTLKPVKTPFTMYSSVLGDFVITQLDENKQLHRYDTKGNTYTQQQVDSLLPSLYVRQLTADERFPDTIGPCPMDRCSPEAKCIHGAAGMAQIRMALWPRKTLSVPSTQEHPCRKSPTWWRNTCWC